MLTFELSRFLCDLVIQYPTIGKLYSLAISDYLSLVTCYKMQLAPRLRLFEPVITCPASVILSVKPRAMVELNDGHTRIPA